MYFGKLKVVWLKVTVKLKKHLHLTLPETQPLPRARFCAESQIPSSRHRDALARAKGSALGTEKTRGTDVLCREGTEPPLGTGVDSRHRGSVSRAAEAGPRHSRHLTAQRTAVMAVCPAVKCAESPLLALGTEHLCRVPATGSRQRIKKKSNSHIQTFSSSTYTPTG
jgi:hypothetical protein